ncbi:MAG: hypothetical protein ACE5KA_05225, partial [Nitrososphaerales archaeon]
MRYGKYLAITSSLVLLLSGTLVNVKAFEQPTDITLEVSSSKIHVGDAIAFSGSLVNSETGSGIGGKTVTIYREGPMIPRPVVTAGTGPDGAFYAEWTATIERNRDTRVTVFAQFDGDVDALPSRTGKTTFTIALKPIELVMTTDGNKNRYKFGETALFSVAFSDGAANFVDPDFLRATYDGKFVEMTNVVVGRYTFETPHLIKFEQHQFGVFAEEWGFQSAQKSITITTFGGEDYKPLKVTASKRGNDIRIMVRNNELSANNVYTFIGTFIGGVPDFGTSRTWQFSTDPGSSSFTFKTTEGYLS